MKKSSIATYFKTISPRWLITWCAIYFGFLSLDLIFRLFFPNTNLFVRIPELDLEIPILVAGSFIGVTILKYTGIVLSFIYARLKFKTDHLLQIALGFTLIADAFLCFDNGSVAGVAVFSLAQFFHFLRLLDKKSPLPIIYASTFATALLVTLILGGPLILVFGAFYATLLISNLVLAIKWYRTVKNTALSTNSANKITKKQADALAPSACAALGFALFVCCDLCVATSFAGSIGLIPAIIIPFVNFFSWLFYYPSQVLISNSPKN